MDTSKLSLLVYDSTDNFEKTKSQLGFEGSTLKRIIHIENIHRLDSCIDSQVGDVDLLFLVIHVFAKDEIIGIRNFLASGIKEKYPNLEYMYISEGANDIDIQMEMVQRKIEVKPIFRYHQVLSELRADRFKALNKAELMQPFIGTPNTLQSVTNFLLLPKEDFPRCDYAIITALEEKEMQKVLPMLIKTGKVENKKHLIEYGYLKSNPQKTIVYASQLATGMIDASILTTEILVRFKPKFLIMAGVLGGKPNEVNIGDVVVATKVFTIDKGKIANCGFKSEIESANTDSSYITSFKREKEKIITYIKENDQTREDRIKIHFGSITCVRQVIDLEGFFEKNITSVDRKAIALEMESYGVSRACEIVNDGNTIALIIKSAMDNTVDKVDNAKSFAAWTSAMFVKYILENDLI